MLERVRGTPAIIVRFNPTIEILRRAHVKAVVGAAKDVELHGLTPVAPLHALHRAKPSDLRRPKPTSDGEGRSVSSFAKATEDTLFAFIHGLHPWLSAKEGKRSTSLE